MCMEMEKEEQKKEQAEVEEPEEEETTLIVRKSRNGSDSNTTEMAVVDVGVSNGHKIQSEVAANGVKYEDLITQEQKIEKLDLVLENEPEPIHGEQKSKNLVFYNEVEGVESTSAYFGEKQIVKDLGHDKFDISYPDFVIQNNSTSVINNRYEADLENDSFSSSNLQPSQILFEESSASYRSSKVIESAEVDLINGDDLEVTELDVERVLQKQTTHDLYCPKCNSCITRRVILRKRKRRIRMSDEEFKKNKIEAAADSKSGTTSVQSPRDHVQHTNEVEVDDNDTQIPTVDDERRRGPDIFRCLSCFSFFIPTGDWFTTMFASNKQEMAAEQGSSFQTDVGRGDVGIIPSSNLGATMEQFDVYTSDQLKESKSIKEVYTKHESDLSVTTLPKRTQVTNGESAEDAISFSQKGGLKLLISSNEGSQTLENSEEGQIPNPATQSGGADKEAIQLSPTSVSVLKASDMDGKLNISVSIPHEEQDITATILTESVLENKNANFRSSDCGQVYPTEVSQHIITKTKFEVHSSESPKVDNISALKGVPVAQGKDTMITIDAQPAGSPQTVQGMICPTETASVLQSATQINIARRERTEARKEFEIEVIKSIVYGGLAESVTSLSVVSSAAGGGAATLNILALGMANLIGGLFIICHNLWELRCACIEQVANQVSNEVIEQRDQYKELLGRRQNFVLHAVVAIISYLIFGLVPPLVYGFSFYKTDDKQLKLVVVGAASLLCIIILAIARAYVQRPPKPYLKSVMTFVILGFMVSGVSYAAGELVERLLEKLGLFQSSSVSNLLLPEMTPTGSARVSY